MKQFDNKQLNVIEQALQCMFLDANQKIELHEYSLENAKKEPNTMSYRMGILGDIELQHEIFRRDEAKKLLMEFV